MHVLYNFSLVVMVIRDLIHVNYVYSNKYLTIQVIRRYGLS